MTGTIPTRRKPFGSVKQIRAKEEKKALQVIADLGLEAYADSPRVKRVKQEWDEHNGAIETEEALAEHVGRKK